MIEPGVAALAAERRSEAEISRLADCLSRMAKSGRRSGTWVQSVVTFHQTVFQATRNDALVALSPMVTSTLAWLCKTAHRRAGHQPADRPGQRIR